MQTSNIKYLVRQCLALTIGLILVAIPLTPGWTADAERERTLIIGKVSPNPKKHYLYLKPIADYVASHMHDLGIDKVKVLMAKNNRQMRNYLKRRKVDWVTETVFSAIEFADKGGAEMILLKHKKGVPVYHTVFFTRKDSGIQSLEDLKGKVIAFEDPGSSTGFFIPAAILLDAGLELVELESPRDRVSGDQVGYVFANAEINMSTWVHKELVDAGAYSNLDWDKEDHNPTSFREGMQIFHESGEYPRAIELVRKDLRAEVKKRMIAVLLKAHQDPEAGAALRAYQKTTQFEEIDDTVKASIALARGVMTSVETGLDL